MTSSRYGLRRALAADRGRRSVAGQHDGGVVQREDLVAQAEQHRRRSEPPGRSVRPIEPAKSTSPDRHSSSASNGEPAPGSRNSTDPPVWPGRVVDGDLQPGDRDRAAVGQLGDVVRLGVRQPAAEELRSRSHGQALGRVGEQLPVAGVHVRGDAAGAADRRHREVWSRWPWVSSTAAGRRRCSASTASSSVSTPMPGSTTTHCLPGTGGDDVAVGAEGGGHERR